MLDSLSLSQARAAYADLSSAAYCRPQSPHCPLTVATAEATAVEDAVALPQPLAVPVVITVTDALAMAVAAAYTLE